MKMNAGTVPDKKFMKFAIETAKEGISLGHTPFGACIVKNGKIISFSYNNVWQDFDITAHAEICAIRNACKINSTENLSGCTIYSTCEPCPMCFSACHWAKISKIVYGTRIEDAQKQGFNELSISNQKMKKLGSSPILIVEDFMRRECLELFELWSERNDKKLY